MSELTIKIPDYLRRQAEALAVRENPLSHLPTFN